MTKQWTDDMGEISGFGGGYEAVCRAMVLAGMRWVDEHPDVELSFLAFESVFGVAVPDNENAEALQKAMMDAPVFLGEERIQDRAGDDCTVAMHHAAVNHVLVYKRIGWDEYCKQLREREAEDGGER